MGTLTVWKFDTAEGAEKATGILKDMAAQRLLTIHDAATVRWEEGKKKPQTKQLNNLAGAAPLPRPQARRQLEGSTTNAA